MENTLIYGRGDGDSTTTPWAALVIDTDQANSNFSLINVTLDDSLGNNYLAYVQYDLATPMNLTLRNCIFRGTGPNGPIWFRDTVHLTADYNLFYLPNNDRVIEHGANIYTAENIGSLGQGNLYGNPRFVAPAWGGDGDYHLQGGSPAIDAGHPDPQFNDPYGSRNDIGAFGGPGTLSTSVEGRLSKGGVVPDHFRLFQNFPNPFNPRTAIRFALPEPSAVTLEFFDLLGKEVATLVDEELQPGEHKVVFDARSLSSGVYFYRLEAKGFVQSKKFLLLK